MKKVRKRGTKILSKRAFTLIELLVTTAMMGMVSAAILVTFGSGLRIYERVKNFSGVQVDAILSLEKMEEDLRKIFLFSEIGFIGDASKVSFPGLVLEVDEQGDSKDVFGRISYFRDEQTGTLMVQRQSYAQSLVKNSQNETSAEILVLVEDLKFSYYYFDTEAQKYDWKNVWDDKEEALPKGVKVRLTYKDGEQEITMVRMVLIPVG